jgi:hypothetical protein
LRKTPNYLADVRGIDVLDPATFVPPLARKEVSASQHRAARLYEFRLTGAKQSTERVIGARGEFHAIGRQGNSAGDQVEAMLAAQMATYVASMTFARRKLRHGGARFGLSCQP